MAKIFSLFSYYFQETLWFGIFCVVVGFVLFLIIIFKMRNRSLQVDNIISEVWWKQTNECIKYSHQRGTLILLKSNLLVRKDH